MKKWSPEEIKEFRKRQGLYQKHFADLLGVTERYVIFLEKGGKIPSKTLRLFLDCLEGQLKSEKEKGKGVKPHGKTTRHRDFSKG